MSSKKMIIYATLLRSVDGTPLSATTDFKSEAETSAREGKRIVKMMSKRILKLPERVCLQTNEIAIHCISNPSTAYIVVCEANYPHILAFSFLDELMKEFTLLYTPSVVNSVRRPYAFIEFDNYLQKVRQKYNSPHSLAARIDFQVLTYDLNLHPPTYLELQDLEPPPSKSNQFTSITNVTTSVNMNNGSLPNGSIPDSTGAYALYVRLKPITWYGKLAMFLACPCIMLNAYRGAVSLSSSTLEGYDGPSTVHGFCFITEIILLTIQIQILRRYNSFRKLCTLSCALGDIFVNIILLNVREVWVVLLYLGITCTLVCATFKRTFERKLPNINV